VDVDVGTHGRASLREKTLAKTGAKRAFFNQNSGYINSYFLFMCRVGEFLDVEMFAG